MNLAVSASKCLRLRRHHHSVREAVDAADGVDFDVGHSMTKVFHFVEK